MQNKKYKLQVILDQEEKEAAELVIKKAGFSSLPDAVRFIVYQIKTEKPIDFHLSKPKLDRKPEKLTKKQIASLQKSYQDFLEEEKKGNIFSSDSVEELIRHLDEYEEK